MCARFACISEKLFSLFNYNFNLTKQMDKRNTKQKTAIREAFSEAGRPLSAEEVLEGAQHHHPALGIATVYRNIQNLVEDGWLTPVELPGQSTRYELAGKEHHHHFHCNTCGKLFELEGCIAQSKPRVPRGFRTTGHEFFLYGICAACNPARPHARA
jgi:Fur family transcriptional regulator, ferric uptake regulator